MTEQPLAAILDEPLPGEVAVAPLAVNDRPVSRAAASPTAADAAGASWTEVRDNPWLLVSVLFGVTAVLGLPLLWQSKAFTWRGKLSLSLAVIAWTGLLVWLCALVLQWSYARIVNSL
jgi:hypothetical protein